ncbi:hypothetical protein RRG08_000979 [Elysia crispata]|uniref:Uncharacterized protein n=1 Tax=Elysia crispata TaxID=231223 RepID=A0AAE1AFC3_9GAST|nr:hypothetical protein RRG08_000979 [Elysia crispata]
MEKGKAADEIQRSLLSISENTLFRFQRVHQLRTWDKVPHDPDPLLLSCSPLTTKSCDLRDRDYPLEQELDRQDLLTSSRHSRSKQHSQSLGVYNNKPAKNRNQLFVLGENGSSCLIRQGTCTSIILCLQI